MATNPLRLQQAYGIGNALQPLPPFTIVAQRAPTTSDRAKLGTFWDYVTGVGATDEVYMLTSVVGGASNWKLLSNGGGAAVFTSLTVNGNSVFNGDITQAAGDIDLGSDAVAQTIDIGTGAAAKTITIGSTNTTSGTTINGGSNGIVLTGNIVETTVAGSLAMKALVVTPNDAIVAATCNAWNGSVRFNNAAGWVAAAGALLPAPFVISNNALAGTEPVMVTLHLENGTAANCMLKIVQVLQAAGQITIYIANDVTAAGASDCTRCVIDFIVMQQ